MSMYKPQHLTDINAEAQWLYGIIHLKNRNIKKAEEQIRHLYKVIEKYKISENNYKSVYKYYLHLKALIAENRDDLLTAESCFRKLLNMKPGLSYWVTYFNYQFFHTEYAKMLKRNKLFKRAESEIRKTLEFSPSYIPALWIQAELYEKNRPKEARAIYRKINYLYKTFEPGIKRDESRLSKILKTKLK